tara:strand:+ start:298 stop:495 length:198 start_codon:yes stop_codon:yes gene_type:complete
LPQKNKTPISVHIESTQLSWLEDIINEYKLGDISKATRVLLDYAMLEGSKEDIFSPDNMRCNNCG